MGICTSCHSTNVATAKLILPDGSLQEFFYPIKVSDVLRKHPSFFICNSDEMDFDDVVSAVKHDDELQSGQLYFALPLNRLTQPLQPEEMAALAVKASTALNLKNCGCRRRHRKNNICFTSSFSGEKGPGRMRSSSKVADAETIGTGTRRRSCGGAKRQINFKTKLSSIPE